MKAKMNHVIMTLVLTLGICLLFPIVASAQEGIPCTPDPVDMFIGYGNLITCSLDQPGIVDIYRFNGTAGQRIEIVASSGVTWACIELVGVTTACAYGTNRNWIDTVLSATQEYTIRVYDYGSGTGSYELDLESVVPPSPNARQTAYDQYLTDQINPAGDLDVLFFTASVGDVVDIVVNSETTWACVALYAPDTHSSWNACAYGTGRNEITTSPLTVAGTYSMLIYDYSATGYGAYSVNLDCLSGPCVVTPISDIAGYLILRGTPLAGVGVSLTQPGSPFPQLTRTDNNGYYQFLHIIAGQAFNILIHDSTNLGEAGSADAASANTVDKGPKH